MGDGVSGAGAGAGAGVSAAGISVADLPMTQSNQPGSPHLQLCLWLWTTTKTAAITIKISRILIRAPSLLRRRKVYEWAANKKGGARPRQGFHGAVIWLHSRARWPIKVIFTGDLARLHPAGGRALSAEVR